MPKLKTNGSAKKRYRVTAGGIKRKSSFRNHILTKKRMKLKRHLRGASMVHESDLLGARRLLNLQ